ncbi:MULTISPECIES: ZIP family metal transporter [unclassified Agromyces]|uniref:ZIP family metal transporter n=1 Tax=unclassified Agromyces TaxID=2639701 RepID=UPI0007B290C6|nr:MULTISPECIES: ZIP family zinc transporter [unclassified Agromyces]KZE95005.1 Zinc transporter ZupT [Agromyces sp. NDB4Y10]MCK8610465.1 ZIP family zinc transporter [Agromyces sp. C10]
MPEWGWAALAGLAAGGALLAGAVVAWLVDVPRRIVAGTMAFGAGVLISALAFDLVLEAQAEGGLGPTVLGFGAGAIAYVLANRLLDRFDQRNPRGRGEAPGTGTGIAVGALLDGIPESAVLGLSMVGGSGVSVPVLLAIVISNVPEGLSSTAELKASGRSARWTMLLWAGIALACALAAIGGFVVLDDASGAVTAFVTAIAAGAILAMICDTMIPDAFRTAHEFTGLLATLGFLAGYAVHQGV